MKVYRNTSAYSQLESFAQDSWGVVGELVKFILNNKLKGKFNDLMENEYFKDGVEEDEFKGFVLENADSLKTQLERIADGNPIDFK